jgi:chromosome segregation ATPase
LRKQIFEIKRKSAKLRGQEKDAFLDQTLKECNLTSPQPSASVQVENIVQKSKEEALETQILETKEALNLKESQNKLLENQIQELKKTRKRLTRQVDSLNIVLTSKREQYAKLQRSHKTVTRSFERSIVRNGKQKGIIIGLKSDVEGLKERVKELNLKVCDVENEKDKLNLQLHSETAKCMEIRRSVED